MTDIGESLAQLAKGASVVFIGTVIGKFLALVGQIFIVRSLSPGEFGTIALAFTIVSAVGNILALGSPQGVPRLLAANDHINVKIDYLRSGLLIAGSGGLLGAIGVYTHREGIQELTNTPGMANLLSIFAIFVFISPIGKVLIGGLRGFKRPSAKAIVKDIFGRLGSVCVFLVFLATGDAYFGAIAYWISFPVLVIFGSVYFLNESAPISKIVNTFPTRKSIRSFISYSWPLALSGSFVLLMSQLDVLMIGFFLAPTDVGLYRAIQPLKEVVLFFLMSFTFLYLPIATEYFTKRRFKDLNMIYTTATKWIVTATFPIVLVCVLFPKDIIRILFTSQYSPASTAFVLLVLGMFSRVLVGPNGTTVQAINEPQIEMYAGFFGGMSNAVLNLFLIPAYGIEGAAVGTGIGFIIYNSVEIIVIYQKVGIVPFSRDILKPVVATTVVGVMISEFIGPTQVGIYVLLAIGITFAMCQLIFIFLTRSFDEGDKLIAEQIDSKTGTDIKSIIDRMDNI